MAEQVVQIAARAATFTAVCTVCGSTFAGRLELDLRAATFLCRHGHVVRVEREEAGEAAA